MRILVVDDNAMHLEVVGEWLKDDSHEVLLAKNGKYAIRQLFIRKVDIVITDLRMPVMDGFQLISLLREDFPGISIIVITGIAREEVNDFGVSLDSLPLLSKPFNRTQLIKVVRDVGDAREKGYIRGVSLANFLQLLAMEGKTTVLRVKSAGATGFLFLENGEVIDAKLGDVKGAEAARYIVGWEKVEISILDIPHDRKRTIRANLIHLLLDTARRKDKSQF